MKKLLLILIPAILVFAGIMGTNYYSDYKQKQEMRFMELKTNWHLDSVGADIEHKLRLAAAKSGSIADELTYIRVREKNKAEKTKRDSLFNLKYN